MADLRPGRRAQRRGRGRPRWPASIAWRARLDGAVYGQPLLVGNLVIAATENDSLYALAQSTGRLVWRAHVGTPVPLADLPCGNIDPLGITGTPAYDAGNGLVYAVAETSGYHHVLVGVSVANGARKVQRDIPAPDGQPRYDQQRPALAIGDGRVYVAFGGLYGDCGPYRGSVAGVPLSGSGPIVSYVAPTPREAASGHRRAGHAAAACTQRGQRLGEQYQLPRRRLSDDPVPRAAAGDLRACLLRSEIRTISTSAPRSPRCWPAGGCSRSARAAPATCSTRPG